MKKLTFLAALGAVCLAGSVFVSCGGDDGGSGSDSVLKSIKLDAGAARTSFTAGDEFTAEGLVVKAVWSTETVTLKADEYSVTFPEANLSEGKIVRSEGSTGHREAVKVTVLYQEMTSDYEVTVNDPASGIALSLSEDVKTVYTAGEEFDPAGITVTAFYGEDDTEGEDVTEDALFTVTYRPSPEGEPVEFTAGNPGVYEVTLTVSYGGKSVSETASVTVLKAGTLPDTGSEDDLAPYAYHKSILAGMSDSWGGGTEVSESDGKIIMKSGFLWGAGGVCGVSSVKLGEIAEYAYIVFTVDASEYTISEPQEKITSNTGVNVKVPEILARPAKWFTKNGKTTYYIASSEFSSASAATAIALIIGGEGTLVLEEFYLAAEKEPEEKELEYADTTIYSKGDTLAFAEWGVGVSAEFTDEGIVANGMSPYYAVTPAAPVPFRANAKLEVTYSANAAWKIKPVAPEVEIPMESGENLTVEVPLGDADGILTSVGLVLSVESTEVTITSIKVTGNSQQ